MLIVNVDKNTLYGLKPLPVTAGRPRRRPTRHGCYHAAPVSDHNPVWGAFYPAEVRGAGLPPMAGAATPVLR
jgi:hypothetical protein